jgi:hypothetical protein
MSERDLTQSEESLESGSEGQSSRDLDETTHEPNARVEQKGTIDQAETIEKAVTDLVGTDRKVSQTDSPDAAKEELKPAKNEAEGGDAATPINLPSPEARVGGSEEKAEPDPKGSEVKVADEPKSKKAEKAGDETETPESLEATPITLPDKVSLQATPITLPSVEGQVEEAEVELPEQARMGVEQDEFKADEQGIKGPSIPGIEGLPEDDPFGQGGMGPDIEDGPSEIDDAMPDFQETIEAAQMERDPFDPGRIGGGPGSIHPNYGESGQGMVSEDDDAGSSSEDKEEVVSYQKKMQAVREAEMKLFEAINERDKAEKDYKDNPDSDAASEALDTADGNYWEAVNHYNFLVSDKAQYKGEVRMPRPEGDEGEVEAPKSEEDIKFTNEAIDPAMMQGGPHSSGVDHRKHPGVVSDPAEMQDAGKPDSGIKVDRSINVDPAGDELGKEAEEKDD